MSHFFYRKVIPLFACLLLITSSIFLVFFTSSSTFVKVKESNWQGKLLLPADKLNTRHSTDPGSRCKAYAELRNINFLGDSIKGRICSGVTAYSVYNGSFPLCQLPDNLPEEIMDQVRSGSELATLTNRVTGRRLPCYVYSGPDLISDSIRKHGSFESKNVAALIGLLRRLMSDKSAAPNGVIFLDVGANIGVFSLAAMDLGAPVVSLDANIRNLLRIRLSALAMNRTGSANVSQVRSRLLWNFISSRVSLSYLNFPPDCNVGGATKFSRAVADTIPVMSSTGDAIADAISPDGAVLLMKMDIEGGEADFLKTSQRLFDNYSIPVVHMEWLKRHMSEDERIYMLNFFSSRHYVPRAAGTFAAVSAAKMASFEGDIVWAKQDFVNKGYLGVA